MYVCFCYFSMGALVGSYDGLSNSDVVGMVCSSLFPIDSLYVLLGFWVSLGQC